MSHTPSLRLAICYLKSDICTYSSHADCSCYLYPAYFLLQLSSNTGRHSSFITAALAVSQVSSFCHPQTPYPGPYSISVLEERIAEFNSDLQRLSSLQIHQEGRWRGTENIQCHRDRQQQRPPVEDHMSQAPTAYRATEHQSNGHKKSLSPQDQRPLPPIQNERLQNQPRSVEYTPTIFQQSSNSTLPELLDGTSSRPAGPLGMQNLLNPSAQDASKSTIRQRSADDFNLPAAAAAAVATPLVPSSQPSQSPSNTSLPSITPPSSTVYLPHTGQPPRRILTPHTPSLYSTNHTTVGLPSGTIDAAKSPFINSRENLGPVGASGHALPMVPQGPNLPVSSSSVLPAFNRSPPGRRSSNGVLQLQNVHERRASAGGPPSQPLASQSNSPSTSYSSYSRFSRTPPVSHAVVATSQPSSFFAPHHDGKGSTGSSGPPNLESKETFNRVANSMGHSTLQMMTLDTEQGPIQVPVDVTAASKVADEKRKRNATASHRFRQRRKEKERETSQNIAKLEHQIRELAEERDYYRLERDFFRSVTSSDQRPARLPPRPPSPRQVRLAQLNGEKGVFRDGQWHTTDEENSRHGRNTRRRTSAYKPATDIVQSVNAVAPQHPQYASMSSKSSENADQLPSLGIRNHPLGPPARPFDPAVQAQYNRAWKAS